jgi:DNA modification methylase
MINEVLHGDCLDVLKTFPDNYFDSLVTDPPASFSFMSKKWDDDKGGITPSTGTAARYFKQLPFDTDTVNSIYDKAKASTTDRNCKGLVNNDHPTVKSRHLMAYFIKLITPPNGIVLDPFGGSGTTAVSAIETGFNYVLIEKEEEYLNIINQRISATKSKIKQLELTTN